MEDLGKATLSVVRLVTIVSVQALPAAVPRTRDIRLTSLVSTPSTATTQSPQT